MNELGKILVTGAGGYIGQRLVGSLLRSGAQVVALVREPGALASIQSAELMIVTGDVTRPETLVKAVQSCSQIYHLASTVGLWRRDPAEFERVNVGGTVNMLQAAVAAGVRRVLICSSCGIFGPSRDGRAIDENKPVDPRAWGPYESSKFRQVEVALGFRSHDLEIVTAYPSRVFGPGPDREANSLTKILRRIAAGKWMLIPGDGKAVGNYVFVDDVVRGLRLVMDGGTDGEGYIIGGSNLSYNDLFRLADRLGSGKAKFVKVPRFLVRAIASTEQFRSRLLGTTPRLTAQAVQKYLADWPVSIAKIEGELGFRPSDIEAAIRATIAAPGSGQA